VRTVKYHTSQEEVNTVSVHGQNKQLGHGLIWLKQSNLDSLTSLDWSVPLRDANKQT